jgi:hypothetical protein
MDDTRCIEPSALEEVLAAGPSDPRRLHVVACPRCRALAESFALFLTPPDDDPATTAKADALLTAFRERLLDSSAAPSAGIGRDGGPKAWWQALFAPSLRPAWAFAVVAIVAAGWYLTTQRDGVTDAGRIHLRGARLVALELTPPVFAGDGSVTLAWQPSPEADSYQVRFFSTSLAELSRLPSVSTPTARVAPGGLPGAAGETVLYRVAALRGGDVMAMSPVGTLQKP